MGVAGRRGATRRTARWACCHVEPLPFLPPRARRPDHGDSLIASSFGNYLVGRGSRQLNVFDKTMYTRPSISNERSLSPRPPMLAADANPHEPLSTSELHDVAQPSSTELTSSYVAQRGAFRERWDMEALRRERALALLARHRPQTSRERPGWSQRFVHGSPILNPGGPGAMRSPRWPDATLAFAGPRRSVTPASSSLFSRWTRRRGDDHTNRGRSSRSEPAFPSTDPHLTTQPSPSPHPVARQ